MLYNIPYQKRKRKENNCVASNVLKSSSSSSIYVRQLFSIKKLLYTKLSNIAIKNKFGFKLYKSTTIHYEARYALNICKWSFRATRLKEKENVKWLAKRCDKYTLVRLIFSITIIAKQAVGLLVT